MQPLQVRPRFDSYLVHQQTARAAVRLQRLGLPPGPIEREHELPVQALAQGVLRHERLELAD
jgi:hypothetical protein